MIRWEWLHALGLACLGLAMGCPDPSGGTGEGSEGTGEATSSGSTAATTSSPPPDDDVDESGEPVGCADSEICVEPAPEGWLGPVVRAEDDIGITLPNCLDPYPDSVLELRDGLMAALAQCGECSCKPATGVECSAPNLHLFGSSDCIANGLATEPVVLDPSGQCVMVGGAPVSAGVQIDPISTVPDSGTCAPQSEEPIRPPAEWSRHLRACAPGTPLTACGDGGVCAPSPAAALDPTLCIHRAGEHACPAGPYSERTVWYDRIRDTRGCTACTCGPPQGQGSCHAEVTLSTTPTCDDDYVQITEFGAGQCTPLPMGSPGSASVHVIATDNLGCQSEGKSEPEGQAMPADPVTLCCSAG